MQHLDSVNGLIIRGVLRISDEAQRCLCNVELTAILLVIFDLAYDLSFEYSQLRISDRCTIINSTLYSTT